MALDHLSSMGRCREPVFNSSSLIGFARQQSCVQATFAPADWNGLTIRSTWGPTPGQDGVDLEIQISTTDTVLLRRVEVGVLTTWHTAPGDNEGTSISSSWVEPRDVAAAGSSYDGRETPVILQGLTTLPVPPSAPPGLPPRMVALAESRGDRYYIEMVQPNDCARRITGESPGPRPHPQATLSTLYGLFGHDLERGVVLRARVRGLWIRTRAPELEAARRAAEFLREPPPLGP